MRLENYIKRPHTIGMTDAIVKVLAEVLCVLAVATKGIKENCASKSIHGDRSTPSTYSSSETFVKKLIGRSEIEDALQRLETVIEEETRMATTEVLKDMHEVKNTLNAFGDILQGVDERVKDIGHKDINGAQTHGKTTSHLYHAQCFMRLDVDKAERPLTNTTPRISPENAYVEDESMKVEGAVKDIDISKLSRA